MLLDPGEPDTPATGEGVPDWADSELGWKEAGGVSEVIVSGVVVAEAVDRVGVRVVEEGIAVAVTSGRSAVDG